MLRITAISIVVSLSLLACGGGNSNSLTEAMIEEVQQAIETAVVNEDADTIARHLSDDAVIELSMASPNGSKTQTMDKSEYLATMKQGWRVSNQQDYNAQVHDIRINANSDRAIVESTVTETSLMGGQTIKSKTLETVHFQLIDGKALVTRVEARLSVDLAGLYSSVWVFAVYS